MTTEVSGFRLAIILEILRLRVVEAAQVVANNPLTSNRVVAC